MTAIIQVPSTFPVKLPQGEWINLAAFRRVEIIDSEPVIHIIWDNIDDSIYQGEQAQAIIDALEVAHTRAAGATGAIAQQMPSGEEAEKLLERTSVISMVALALLSEAVESDNVGNSKELTKEFFFQAKYFCENSSEKNFSAFMHKHFNWLPSNPA